MHAIPFNKPCRTGNETRYIEEAAQSGKISGNGPFTQRCQTFFEKKYGFPSCLLTPSCTDALEMAAILLDIQPGDEVILPAFTFVSTANAFVLRGATIVLADSSPDHPNLDAARLEARITPRTKAIVPVHYAGMACEMESILALADKYGLWVVEDAATAVDGHYRTRDGALRPLGGIGHLAAFSFHETKNVSCGEGGMLVVNDARFAARAEIIRDKGTNQAAYRRGEADQYGWTDVGSSFSLSEINAAFLYAQLEQLAEIQRRRLQRWMQYHTLLAGWEDRGILSRPKTPQHARPNAHSYYICCRDAAMRRTLIAFLKENGVCAASHYAGLHRSPFFKNRHDGRALPHADRYTDTLLRLPLYCDLSSEDVARVCALLGRWVEGNR